MSNPNTIMRDETIPERRQALMIVLANAAINVAARDPMMRGPWIFDEAELQKMAAGARRYLRSIASSIRSSHE